MSLENTIREEWWRWHSGHCDKNGELIMTEDEKKQELPEYLRWKSEGPPPKFWYAEDGTKVYRSYKDYCDD